MYTDDLRPVKFNAYYDGLHPAYINPFLEGYFHRWADDAFLDSEDYYHQRTFAVIEDKKGKIYKVPPENVVFQLEVTLEM